MTTSRRIVAVLLGLFGIERIIYADILSVLPDMAQPTPALNLAMGLVLLVVAVGLYLGFGWARWPGVIGAAMVGLQGIAYVAWGLSRDLDPTAAIFGSIEPLLAALIIERLVRHWPADGAWNERLR